MKYSTTEEVTDAEKHGFTTTEPLPEHEHACGSYGTTRSCGPRGCFDPNKGSEREYRAAIRESHAADAGTAAVADEPGGR